MTSQPDPPGEPVEVFYSYSHKDEKLRDKLDNHLTLLQRQGFITEWHDRQIEAGDDWANEISEHLNSAQVILLLVSDDFIASDYCYSVETARALERHEQGEAVVIPIILRPVDWESSPLGRLQALPKNAKPVVKWGNRDEAFKNVAQGIREIIKNFQPKQKPVSASAPIPRRPEFGFVTRRDEEGRDIVGRLKDELAPGQNRLVTLSGPGGIGKTTLAAEAARVLKGVYKGRLVWSSADSRADYKLLTLLDDIATQLGHPHLRTLAPEAKAERVRALVAAAPTLVMLDNCETIATEEQKHIESWFTQAECSALFTSRAGVGGSSLISVSVMSREEATEFLDKLVRETRDRQMFTPDVRHRIYETAEANPFAMQWVTAQIDLAQEPDAVLEELKAGKGDAAQRVFDRSFNLPQLGDDGRDTLLALSLFTPSAPRDALAKVAGLGEQRLNEAVKNLRALWLIKGLDSNRRLAVEGLTRTLIESRLSRDPRAGRFRSRFIIYYSRYAGAHAQPTLENFDALEAEKDNLLRAVDTAFDLERWEVVLKIMDSLEFDGVRGFLSTRGYWEESLERGQKAIKATHELKVKGAEARYIHNTTYIRRNQGADRREVRELYNESLKLAEIQGDQALIALILHEKAGLEGPEEARRLYLRSLQIKERINDFKGIGYSLHELASLKRKEGKLAEATELYRQSLKIAYEYEDERGIAGPSLELGWIERRRRNHPEAHRLYTEALTIKNRWGDKRGVAGALCELGALELDRGNAEEARRLLNRSLELNRQINHPQGMANSLRELGRLELTAYKKLTSARRYYKESLEITKKLGEDVGSAVTIHQLGIIAEESGDEAAAALLFREALAILERYSSPDAKIARESLVRVGGESP